MKRILFIFLLGLVLLGLIFRVGGVLQKKVWNGKDRINLVIENKGTFLISFLPKNKELTVLIIPDDVYLEVVHGYGNYRLGAISALSVLEKRDSLLAETIQENIGVSVDGWISILDQEEGKAMEAKDLVLNSVFKGLSKGSVTNLSPWDLLNLWLEVRQAKINKAEVISLKKISVLTELKLPDNTIVYLLDKNLFESTIKKYFEDPGLTGENFTIEIFNSTEYPGIAERAARLITNTGGRVIGVGNNDDKRKSCLLLSIKEKKNSYTLKKIKRIFGCIWEEGNRDERGDIRLILGEDYWDKLNKK